MRGTLLALVLVGTFCHSALGQPPVTPTTAKQTADDASPAKSLTHRRAGQLQWLDPDHWEIRGCQTYSAEAIRRALAIDLDVTRATHPSAPADNLEKLPALLRDKVANGYQSNGFPQPQVNVQRSDNDKKILIDIVEGRRCNCGSVEITGTNELSQDQLLTGITQPEKVGPSIGASKKPRRAIWKVGKPATLSTVDVDGLRTEIERILSDLGRPAAKFDVKIDSSGDTARLILQILDEGPAATVGRVEVTGNEKNSAEQIVDYLAIKPGTIWTHDEKLRIERLLYEAARFRRFKVKYNALDRATEGVISVSVTESRLAPPLSQEFSPEEQAVLKFGRWMFQFASSGEDLVFSTNVEDDVQGEFIFSATHGCIVTVSEPNEDKQGPAFPARSVVFSKDAVGLYSGGRGRQCVGTPIPGAVTFEFIMDVVKEGDKESISFRIGGGAKAANSGSIAPGSIQLSITAPPVAMIALLHHPDTRYKLVEDVLAVETLDGPENGLVRIDARTGKLLDWVLKYPEGGEQRVSLVAGAYQQRIKDLEAAFQQKPNDFDPKQPLASVVRFVLEEGRSPDLERLEIAPPALALNVLQQAIEQGMLEPLDDYLVHWPAKLTGWFQIPINSDPPPKMQSDFGKTVYLSWAFGNDIAARDTWPWVLARETVAWAAGTDEYQKLELAEQLEMPDNGPLRCLVTAELLLLAEQHEAARQFAALGLERLSPQKFHRDVAELLDERGLLGRCLLKWADVVRRTDPLVVKLLGSLLPEEQEELLENSYLELAKDKDQPIAQALPTVLDKIWDAAIKPNLESALNDVRERAANNPSQLAKPESAPNAPATARDVKRDDNAANKK